MFRVMNLTQEPSPTLSSSTNLGDGLIKAWEVFKNGLSTDIRTTPTNRNDIPRVVVILTENAIPVTSSGPNQSETATIAQRMREGNFSGTPSSLNAVSPSDVPTIDIFAVGM